MPIPTNNYVFGASNLTPIFNVFKYLWGNPIIYIKNGIATAIITKQTINYINLTMKDIKMSKDKDDNVRKYLK